MIPYKSTHDSLYEYACHEGNYGMHGILAGTRVQEKAEHATAKRSSNR